MKSLQTSLLFSSICLLLISCTLPAAQTIFTAEPSPPNGESRTLTICLEREPESLYYYAAASGSAQTVLQAIYDGPIDMQNGEAEPVILEGMPAFEDGSASFQPAAVSAGEEVIDSRGRLTSLQAGVEVFPSGCASPDCVLVWDGSSELQVDQLVLRYTLKSGILWSDGWPLQADDSVFSYEIASDPATPIGKRYIDRTASYRALDALTVEWTGKPGLVTDAFEDYFWMPLPRHAWGALSAKELLEDEAANRSPLGWGPYVLADWQPGEQVQLERNPNYFRINEGIPFFEQLIFKITNPQDDTFLANLRFNRELFKQFDLNFEYPTEGVSDQECDLTVSRAYNGDLLEDIYILENYYQDPAIGVIESAEGTLELLVFNLREEVRRRENPLQDKKLRKILPLCIDRERILREQFYGTYHIPSFIRFARSIETDQTEPIYYDPEAAGSMLAELGWSDRDHDQNTPRETSNGQSLNFLYLVEDDPESMVTAQTIKESMMACGISINIHSIPKEIFWNSSSEDSVFAGNFDMAQIALPSPLPNPCMLFDGGINAVPGKEALSLNFLDYQNDQLEKHCMDAAYQTYSEPKMELIRYMEVIINKDLPALPLYSSKNLLLARNDFCEIQIPAGVNNELQNIELFNYGEDCTQ